VIIANTVIRCIVASNGWDSNTCVEKLLVSGLSRSCRSLSGSTGGDHVEVRDVVSMVQPLCLSALIDCEVRPSSRAHSRGSPTYWGLFSSEALLS
jgi:hypothetical protein